MRIAVTGASGQLGRDVLESLQRAQHEVIGLSRTELDITDLQACRTCLQAIRPEAIIHCAAHTAVDLAESETDLAYSVNAWGTRNIAVAAEAISAKVVYISTDYVFDGTATTPYTEFDATFPQSVYGKSKLAGEQLLQSLCSRYFIVRTSWVFGKHGANFVKTMLMLGRTKDRLQVVHDQFGSPTYTIDLAAFLGELVQTERYGIYHASNTGSCSWYEFAQEIFKQAAVPVEVEPCTTEQFSRPAPRPRFSVMNHMAIRTNGFSEMRPWPEAVSAFLRELGES
ncbi:dTDP-4-dehydrorhamnose reductase [Paenibacillus athensensis]|uniref:dTDP-4-dehydrorhamnose reductase n=1 Tax=Paenibacillus athensensis TaxID=1967502 RepID=A0A4Y8Q7J3_9BACL|nr:dTDP-4-dehydrorhamnose reductase [Paenibacillus athensensis]MCD1259512.1 dTDP-4-dehydrorhamnose reductase [Paenibacillus athensensis]